MPPLESALRTQYVIGLAGHIDHGKSALVQALTGSQTDRLPEEKRRGITIDLGFAHFDADGKRFALIDVPGHERFVHTMVAGASGIDAALLVVAADDSVMPQTREHLALLELLGVRRGVIAISKCDLANDELLELVELEVAELAAGTFLANAPRLRVSAQTGSGIDELRRALIDSATSASLRNTSGSRFRLPIDRVFSPAGQGAVVTGTVWSGTAKVGDILEHLPAGEEVRIRRLQSQGRDVDRVAVGERAAINIVGIKAAEIQRGDELATPEAFPIGKRHLVELRLPPAEQLGTKQSLQHRQLVRLHLGANQTTAQVLLDQREVLPGQTAFAVIRTAAWTVAEHGQRFVLRQLSPPETIGGGTILLPALQPTEKLKRCLAAAPGLASTNPSTKLKAYLELRGELGDFKEDDTPLDFSLAECEVAIAQLLQQQEIVATADQPACYVTTTRFTQLKQRLLRRCQQELERRKPASQVPANIVLAALARHASQWMWQKVLETLVADRELILRGERLGFPSGAKLTHRQQQLLSTMLNAFLTAGRVPPTNKELAEQLKIPLKDLEQLIQVAIDDGQLIKLSPLMAIDRDAIEELRRSLADYFQQQPTAKVGELREQWGITRKHAVPIFEFFDNSQITLRKEDLRIAGPRLLIPIGEELQ